MTAPIACENRCGRPAAKGWGICRGCYRRTAMHLTDLAGDLSVQLELTLTGQGQIGPGRVGGPSANTPLPFDERASRVVTEIHAQLVGWCLLLRDEGGAPLPEDSIAAMAMHLTGWLDWLAKHPAVGEFTAEVAGMAAAVERTIDLPPTRSRIFVGACPENDGEPCPGELWVTFPRDRASRPEVACTDCGSTYEPERWGRLAVRLGRAQMDVGAADRLVRSIFEQPA